MTIEEGDDLGGLPAFILDDDGEPIKVPLLAWGQWLSTHHGDRVVMQESLGRVLVSTVFLGLDHRFGGEGPPILWETLVFGGVFDGRGARYSSRLEALIGHAEMVALVEQHRDAPRRIKKALGKFATGAPLQPGDVRRVDRVLARVARRR